MHKKRTSYNFAYGYTLTEMLVVIAILAILVSLAVPTFIHLFKKYESYQITHTIHSLIKKTKTTAFIEHKSIILCPTNDFIQCNKTNPTHLMSFDDVNNNKVKDHSEHINTSLNIQLRYGKIRFNLSRRSRYMRFFPDNGMPRGHFGNITYCPKNLVDMAYAKSVIINKVGKVRFSKDTNKDGIDESYDKKPLDCM